MLKTGQIKTFALIPAAALMLLLHGPSRGMAAEMPSSRDPSPGAQGSIPLSEIRAAEKTVLETTQKVLPAVVFIDGGSGVLVSPEGAILTNDHVVGERKEFKIHFALTGKVGWATLTGRYPEGDLAMLRLTRPEPGKEPFPYLEFGDSDKLRPGEQALAFGNPFLLADDNGFFPNSPADFYPSVSLGVISAIHRNTPPRYPDAIQVDVAVNPGNSGGPLVTLEGKLVGINGKIETRFGLSLNSGVGYAVPSNQVRRFLEPLKNGKGEIIFHGHLPGIEVSERAGSGMPGLSVTKVKDDSAAAKAGFKPGDRILALDGLPMPTRGRFEGIFTTYPVDSIVRFRIIRNEREDDLIVTLSEAKVPSRRRQAEEDEEE